MFQGSEERDGNRLPEPDHESDTYGSPLKKSFQK